MSTAYYSAPISELKTFTYPVMSGSQTIVALGDYLDDRYFFFPDDSLAKPTSYYAQFTKVDLTEACANVLKTLGQSKYVYTLADAQAAAIQQLANLMWAKIFLGFTFTSTASSLTFPVPIHSVQDIVNINGIATLGIVMSQNIGADPTFPLIFIDADSQVHNPTPADAVSLGHQCGQFVTTQYNWFAPLQTQVLQATSIDQVNSILTQNGGQSLYA